MKERGGEAGRKQRRQIRETGESVGEEGEGRLMRNHNGCQGKSPS